MQVDLNSSWRSELYMCQQIRPSLSDNGLSFGTTILTSSGLFSTGPPGINFTEIE